MVSIETKYQAYKILYFGSHISVLLNAVDERVKTSHVETSDDFPP